jgi:hypothetical protein
LFENDLYIYYAADKHIAVAKIKPPQLLGELRNNLKYNSTMRLEKGLKMLIVSSYPRECGLATFSNDIVNAVKKRIRGHSFH